MPKPWSPWVALAAAVVAFVAPAAPVRAGAAREPVVYAIRFPTPESQTAEVEASFPTGGREAVELMMPVWAPGFYAVQSHAGRVQDFAARTPDGRGLRVERPQKNRWWVETAGAPVVVVSYRLACTGRSVTTNWVGADYAVLNGSATFVTLVESARRPHEVRLELPPKWKVSATGLDRAPTGLAHNYRAPDYDTLNDSPIVAGNVAVHTFDVEGTRHTLAYVGNPGQWDGPRAAREVEKVVREVRHFWGFLPFRKYVFLFRLGGAGGLEHLNSTLLASSANPNYPWLAFVCHEYFHAFNVKRLRPVELGPFDYEKPPRTTGLWVSEGLTTYYGELLAGRAGVGTAREVLDRLSSHVRSLQNSPGRMKQTLEESSLNVWATGGSGIGRGANSVSYYVKGPVVGFLFDARIRSATGGKKSLDDVMRLAYLRYSGERGFTAEQFRATAEEVAGTDLKQWFRKVLASTEELDYTEALDWFGLRFAPPADSSGPPTWKLEPRPDVTEAQKGRLREWLGRAGPVGGRVPIPQERPS